MVNREMPVKALIFDYGGVYIDSPFSRVSEVAVEMGVPDSLLKEIIFGSFHVDGDHPWHRLERGEIGLMEARDLVLEKGREHGIEADMFQIFARFAAIDKCLRPALLAKTLEWKQRGYKLGIITNNIKEFTGWRTSFPYDLETTYDVVTDSSYLGIRKPNPAIYLHTLELLGVAPHEALFLDDHPPNVEGARNVGINSFLVEDSIEDAIHWIEGQLLIR